MKPYANGQQITEATEYVRNGNTVNHRNLGKPATEAGSSRRWSSHQTLVERMVADQSASIENAFPRTNETKSGQTAIDIRSE